ncbi:MAG: patatin-like phospholipase family protein [Myxococcota bacterium]|nr:patatin-like phospholipase family protein [Myxococcota bacterium]
MRTPKIDPRQERAERIEPIAEMRVIVVVSPSVVAARRQEVAALTAKINQGQTSPDTSGPLASLLPRLAIDVYDEPSAAVRAVSQSPVHALLIDNRASSPQSSAFAETMAGQTIPKLLAYTDPNRALNRGAILVILPDADTTAHHAFAVGAFQLGGVIVDPPSLETALTAVAKIVQPPKPGKVALCLAGGGIEGMIYEMGALRAIDAHLMGGSVVDFDIFSGISAGGIIGAFLANGVRPDELTDAMNGKPSRVAPFTRSMLFDPNVGEIASRIIKSTGDLLRGNWLKNPVDTAMKITPSALFSGDRMKWHLEKELSKPGMTNDFGQLSKELFIGTTDQDSGAHVTFGDEGFRDIPISHALRASAAMTPYYPPEKIKDRYYIDGIFTRTVNLDIAIARGASLIICIDPLTPMRVETPGYVSQRGGFFNSVQSVKALIRTRLSEVIGRAQETYPHVAVCVFSPTRQDLEEMSVTMMRFGDRTRVEEMAFESASDRIQRDYAWLAADFERHGLALRSTPQ